MKDETVVRRRQATYAALALATVAIGLVVHLFGSALDDRTRDITGDVLWAAMIMWLTRFVSPRASVVSSAAVAYAICVAVELSQLYHSPQFDALRATTGGQLVFGSGYDTRDLIAYAAGVGIAALLSAVFLHDNYTHSE